MQYLLGRQDHRDLRRRRALRPRHPGGHGHLPGALRRRGRGSARPARRELADARRSSASSSCSASRALRASYLTQDVWFVERRRRAGAGTTSRCPRRRRGRGDALRPAPRSSRCAPSSTPSPLRDRRHARAGQRPRRRPCAGRRARRARVGRPSRRPVTCSTSPSLAPRPGGPCVIRFVIPAYNEAENIPRLLEDLAPVARGSARA